MNVLGIPFGKGGLGKGDGSAQAPPLIARHLNCTYSELDLSSLTIEQSHLLMEETVDKGEVDVILGGDHSITYSTVKAFAKRNKQFMLIVFDAHPDLMQDFIPPTHESYLRVLIDDGVVEAKNVVLLGVRNSDKQEDDYLREKTITCYTAKELQEKSVREVFGEILKKIDLPVYVSLDIDVIDPSEAPGTGYYEPDGLKSVDVKWFLNELNKTGKLLMMDVVEVNPENDVDEKTVELAGEIVQILLD